MTASFVMPPLAEVDPEAARKALAQLDDGNTKPAVRLPNLPDEFWESRVTLRRIRQGARAALAGPDMVLAAIICRNAGMASPDLVYDIGKGKGSLNFFAGMVGGTGLGKTTANDVAMDMQLISRSLSDDLANRKANTDLFKDGIGVGTGEGLIEAYMDNVTVERERNGKLVKEKVRQQARNHCYFFVDEGEALGQLMAREGATLGSILRSTWSGAPAGQQNASAEKTRFLARRSYSLGLNIGFQPEVMQFLLADGAAGTPQRFLLMSGYDPQLPDDDAEPVAPIESAVDDKSGRLLTGVITGPEWLRKELREHRKEIVRGNRAVAQLDSQKTAMLGKLASHLCLLDGRQSILDEDWQLAGVMWGVHAAIRDLLIDLGKSQRAEEARVKRDAAVDIALASHQKVADDTAAVERVARTLWRKVSVKGPMPVTELRRGTAYRDRESGLYDRGLSYAEARDWVRVEGAEVSSGGPQPPS